MLPKTGLYPFIEELLTAKLHLYRSYEEMVNDETRLPCPIPSLILRMPGAS